MKIVAESLVKLLFGMLPVLLVSNVTLAAPPLVTNPHLPYPPSCGRMPDMFAPGGLEAQAAKFFDREVDFPDSKSGEQIPMRLQAYRAPCSEPGRSLIWLEFTLAAEETDQEREIELPTAVAEIARNQRKLLSLTADPNGWGSAGWYDRERTFLHSHVQEGEWKFLEPDGDRRWVFVVDNAPPDPNEFGGYGLTPTEYNSEFELVLRYIPYDFLTIDVPATDEILPFPESDMLLSGRLSGSWVIDGAADQGVMISISEKVFPHGTFGDGSAPPMVIFLAHYTFDAEGDPLWLTGAAQVLRGESQVTIPIELVTGGEFRASTSADREVIGTATFWAQSCNDAFFEFDYEAIGLGTGIAHLQRLFSLEIAGYDCRDYESKSHSNQ